MTEPAAGPGLLTLILQSLEDDQAVDVVAVDLEGKTTIADHMVIATGRSTRQVASMAQKIADRVKEQTGRPPRLEGMTSADWVLVDAGDVIVHIFRPEVRTFYNLERMWMMDPPAAAAMRPAASA